MSATESFGRDARSIMNTLGNIKDPGAVEVSSSTLKKVQKKLKF